MAMSLTTRTLFVITDSLQAGEAPMESLGVFPIFDEPREVFLAQRDEYDVPRPIVEGHNIELVRWTLQPTESLLAALDMTMRQLGYERCFQKPALSGYIPGDSQAAAKVITSVVPKHILVHDRHQVMRTGIYIALKAIEVIDVDVSDLPQHDAKVFDGLLWYLPSDAYPFQFRWHDDNGAWAKGTAIPHPEGKESFADTGEHGLPLTGRGRVYITWRAKEGMRSSMNLMAVLLGLEDPAAYINEENERLAEYNLCSFVSQRAREAIAYGAPIQHVLEELTARKYLTRFALKHGRTLLLAPWDKVKKGHVCVHPDLLPEGDGVLRRDPQLFNGGMQTPAIQTDERCNKACLYVNPYDLELLIRLAADFDGDFGSLAKKEPHLNPARYLGNDAKELVSKKKVAMTKSVSTGKYLLAQALNEIVIGPHAKVGTLSLGAQRIAVLEMADEAFKLLNSVLTQTCTQAQKKPVEREFWRLYHEHQEEIYQHVLVDENGDRLITVIDFLSEMKGYSEDEAKREVWQRLMAHDAFTETEEAIVDRARIAWDHQLGLDALKAFEAEWPQEIVDNVAAELPNVEPFWLNEVAEIKELTRLYRDLGAEGENARPEKERRELFQYMKGLFAEHAERVPAELIFSYFPNKLKVEHLPLEWLERFSTRCAYTYLDLPGRPADGVYGPGEITITDDEHYDVYRGEVARIELKHVFGVRYVARLDLNKSIAQPVDDTDLSDF